MIEIIRKQDCVGCGACSQKCPVNCISLSVDEQGFLYPAVDKEKCIDCGLCDRVCPVINQSDENKPLAVFASYNADDKVREVSSSGGVFYEIASRVIDGGGIVFGAKFDADWSVVHGYSDKSEGIKEFQGSKYVQSRIGTAYRDAEEFLKSGRVVLFSGTPCQIAGLKLFLRKDWGTQLITVDIVCHGVPSPLVWKEYLKTIERPKGAEFGKNTVLSSLNKMPVITGIMFRDKRLGWEKYGFSVRGAATDGSGKNSVSRPICNSEVTEDTELLFEPMYENLYMQGFLKDIYLRPSCYECPAKSCKSGADITLGDYWGIQNCHPELYDAKGVSLVMANTDNGLALLSRCRLKVYQTSYEDALNGNSALVKSVGCPLQSAEFWRKFQSRGMSCLPGILVKMSTTPYGRLKLSIKRVIRKIIGEAGVRYIKRVYRR